MLIVRTAVPFFVNRVQGICDSMCLSPVTNRGNYARENPVTIHIPVCLYGGLVFVIDIGNDRYIRHGPTIETILLIVNLEVIGFTQNGEILQDHTGSS